jgi:hypothetical protein
LISATEADFHLVMINGTPRVGTPALMKSLVPALSTTGANASEPLRIAGRDRLLNLAQVTADPAVAEISVKESLDRLAQALKDLPHAAPSLPPTDLLARAHAKGAALLAASGVINNHMSPRPHLPLRGRLTGPNVDDIRTAPMSSSSRATAATVSATPLGPLGLDPLAAVDNPAYYAELGQEQNIPQSLRKLIASR